MHRTLVTLKPRKMRFCGATWHASRVVWNGRILHHTTWFADAAAARAAAMEYVAAVRAVVAPVAR